MLTKRFYKYQLQKPFIAGALLLSLAFGACSKKNANTGSNIPSITYIGISGDSLTAGSNQIIDVVFNFADGNGDLGNKSSSGNYDIYTTDNRDTSQSNYFFPRGLLDQIDPTQGVSGTCTLSIEAAFILLRPDHPKSDTVHYDIYIKDKAGNTSNHITTPDIYIKP